MNFADCSVEDNGGHVAYTKSIDLEKFFNLTQDYVAVKHDMKDEAFDWATHLFLKIKERFNHSDSYCIGELGLHEQVGVDCMHIAQSTLQTNFNEIYVFLLPVSKGRQIPPHREY